MVCFCRPLHLPLYHSRRTRSRREQHHGSVISATVMQLQLALVFFIPCTLHIVVMEDRDALLRITHQACAATWPFTAITTVLFGMKAFSRLRLQRNALGWDDLVIAVSWILDIIRMATFQKAFDSTRNITDANLVNTIPTAAFWVIFVDAWAFLSIALPKLGVGILIIRIFRPQPWLRVSIMTLCVALNIFAIVGFIITYTQCDPVAGQWDPFRHPRTTCWHRSIQIIYSCTVGGLSAFTDIAFSIYPCIVVWNLQMSTRRKISTMALMSLGFASFAFAVVKIVANTALLGKPDVNALLYSGIDIGIWNSIENDFVLSAACLPSVPPFFRACKDFVHTHTSTFSRKSYSTSFAPPKASNEPKGPDDSGAMELARYDELPEAPASKNIKGLTGLG